MLRGVIVKRNLIVVLLLAILVLSSCRTVENVNGFNNDGSPVWTTAIPSSNREIYGVGSAKLTTKMNSELASESLAISDLARKISSTIKENTAIYSNDADQVVRDAYEQIVVLSTNLTIKGIKVEDRWTSEDGNVWTLVSVPTKNLSKIYKDAANDYLNQLEEKRLANQIKLAKLISELSESKDENAMKIKELAEQKVNAFSDGVDHVLASINPEELATKLAEELVKLGYEIKL